MGEKTMKLTRGSREEVPWAPNSEYPPIFPLSEALRTPSIHLWWAAGLQGSSPSPEWDLCSLSTALSQPCSFCPVG